MAEAAKLISALSQILWPLLFVGVLVLLRRELRTLLLQPGAEFVLELMGGKISIVKPTMPPSGRSELPALPDDEQLPPDYLFVNHTSFLRPTMQPEFQRRTNIDLPHYDIRVIVDSYYHGALDRIDRVEYFLHEAYPDPIQVRTRKNDKFPAEGSRKRGVSVVSENIHPRSSTTAHIASLHHSVEGWTTNWNGRLTS